MGRLSPRHELQMCQQGLQDLYQLVYRVCRQVAGQRYSLWDDFLVQGRHEGQKEMTLEELLKHIKVKAHTLSTSHT